MAFEVLITTFEILHQDLDVLKRISWRYLVVDEAHRPYSQDARYCNIYKLLSWHISWHSLVVDEAHRMKNKDSALMHDLRSLDVQHCHLLTGTPLQVVILNKKP
ncbi:hypothetical protein T492DRAFT_835184 [Pavlovales sp. CCMP2436]|nr:hypothetical protein T492DRAFT_835184 [Pavlovales sp. CCMP2436]